MRVFLFILLLLGLQGSAQEVTIKGSSALPGQPIRVIAKRDLVSGMEKVLAATVIDFKGSFMLSFPLQQIEYVQVGVGLHRAEMLLKPACTYTIHLELINEKKPSFFDPQPLALQVMKSNDRGLQQQFETINYIFNTLVLKHFNVVQRMGQKHFMDSLNRYLSEAVPVFADSFLDDYVFYKKGSLVAVLQKMEVKKIYETYFVHQPVGYNNPEYIALLEQFFGNYYLTGNKSFTYDGFVQAVALGLEATKTYLNDDVMIKSNPRLQELVLLIHLNNNYFNPGFYKGSIQNTLQQLSRSSVYTEHRLMANNILEQRNHLTDGSKAPPLSLFDAASRPVAVKLSAQPTLLLFVDESCEVCKNEMITLHDVLQNFAKTIELIVVTTKKGFPEMKAFIDANRWQWNLYHTGDDIFVYERYNIRVFPEYILLYPNGSIAMAPAPPASQNLAAHIDRVIKKFQSRP